MVASAAATEPSSAPAVAPSPKASAEWAKPRTALAYLGRRVDSAADQALVARYQFVILGLWPGIGATKLQAMVSGIKARNPDIKLAEYVMLQEMRDATSASDPDHPLWLALNKNDWWLRKASGDRAQWTAAYRAHDINVTDWAPVNAEGLRWSAVKARFDTDMLLSKMSGIDYVYIDGMGEPLSDGDWKRIGSNQSRSDPEIAAAYRKGTAGYLRELRKLNPGVKLIGNSADVSSPEYKGQVEGVGRECLMGKSWSIETRKGWVAMMESYRAALANTKEPHDVIFGACSPTADAAFYRYGIASALLEDGYFSFSVNGYQSMPWFDESEAPLGTAAEPAPTAPTPSGIWMRRYTNGIVLVNPTATTASLDVGEGYRRIAGAIDPDVNNGLPERVVRLGARQGLVLVRQ